MEKTQSSLKKHLLFPLKLMIRPFKGFNQLKHRENINVVLALFLLAFFGILTIIEYQYTGFIFNLKNPYELNAITLLIASIMPLLIAMLANWSIVTFIEGKGTFKEIFLTLSYSLFPILLARLLNVVVSNFITLDDQMFLKVIFYGGLIWTLYLLFIGLTVIHEFSFGMNLVNIILTLIAFAVIIFLILLFFNLIQNVSGFLESLIKEIIYRIRGR